MTPDANEWELTRLRARIAELEALADAAAAAARQHAADLVLLRARIANFKENDARVQCAVQRVVAEVERLTGGKL